MEMYLKRYYWVAILGSIGASSFLVARTANTFVGSALEPAPLLGLDASHSSGPSAMVITAGAREVGHLFGIEPPPPPPAGSMDPNDPKSPIVNAKICWTCDPVKTGLKLQLLATMVSPAKEFSTALISDLEKTETGLYQIGDKVHAFDVFDIIRDPQRVVIVNTETHKLEFIDGTPGTGVPSMVNAKPEPGGGGEEGIHKLADGKYEISRQKLESTLGDMNALATQARIVPSFKDGQSEGFKLFSIQPGSVYEQIGIQNGDIVTNINGYDINSPEKALEAYTKLRDSNNVSLQVTRHGQPMTMSYGITGN